MALRSVASHLKPMDTLWIIVILSVLFILGSTRPLPPNDLWWHAKIGSDILETGQVPRQDVYSLTENGQPFYYQSWLAEVLLSVILRLGDVRLLVLVRALIVVGLFAVLMGLSWQASGGDRRAMLPVILAAILLGLGNMTVRPQLFAYPLFIAVFTILWLYMRGGARRAIWFVPVLMIVWVNMHGSFALGLGLIWLICLGEVLSYALPGLAGRPVSDGPGARQQLMTLGMVALLSTGALLVNPRGLEILDYVADLLSDAPSQMIGDEWQPPNPKVGVGQSFYFLLLLGMGVLALARPPLGLTKLLLVFAFAWLAATGKRYIVWFALVSAPILAAALVRFPREDLARWRDRVASIAIGQRLLYGDGSGYPAFRRLAQVLLIISVCAALLLLLFLPDEDVWLTPFTGRGAAEFMAENGLRGRLFNELGRGSTIIWHLGPAQPVFIDPRFELYSLEHFREYLALSRAEPAAEALLSAYDFDLLLLDRIVQSEMIEMIEEQPERWKRVYEDHYTALYQRTRE